ncbi:hypothetical protein ACFWXK_15585 [Streptomyces sp. NPDC059070]|uniref:hypothetical protein n=1 Tax=Streptomyces sp. NPDC059070 TaxID=3346713 RepID=UPI003682BB7F
MEYRNVAFGYVPQAGYLRLQWNPEGGIRGTRIFTGQTIDLCAGCDFPIPHEAEPEDLFIALAACNEYRLFGEGRTEGWYETLWGDDSMYRRARDGHGLAITSDGLLRVLTTAAKWGRIRVEVERLRGPQFWQARMWVLHPEEDQEPELGPVIVDAGDVRTMLRAARHLMPVGGQNADQLDGLMSSDAGQVARVLEDLYMSDADTILSLAIFGSYTVG